MSETKLTFAEPGEFTVQASVVQVGPPTVGGYDLGNVHLMVTRRPNRFQRWMARWFFGWRWVDA